jgi:8-oxo-dGTP pyrophosphatase MutT (NUDIX family)/phosphohistidine phosphatase SixA
MTIALDTTVYAAGAVCWRMIDDELNVMLIHRGDRRDVSLPKGKVDPGEALPQTAVREILEETGLKVVLGVPVGITEYKIPSGRDKVVHYWAAEVTDKAIQQSTFEPNNEVEALEWVPVARARERLSYDPDRIILDNFTELSQQGVTRTFAIIVLRHAKAIDPMKWVGADQDRPLAERGLRQADALVPVISAWKPKRLTSSSSLRCRQTITPLANALGKEVAYKESLSQHAFDYEAPHLRKIVGNRVKDRRTAVICSHGPVLPEIVREVALATGTPLGTFVRDASSLDTAEFSVIHLSATHPASGIIAIETHASQL